MSRDTRATLNSTGATEPPVKQGSLRAVIYARVASARLEDSQAASLQLAACRRFAESNGLDIVREYVDLGKPARYSQQVALQQMLLDLAEKRDAVFVVVQDYARLARNVTEIRRIFAQIETYEADVVTIASSPQNQPTSSRRRITL